jgi:hypothetical protein
MGREGKEEEKNKNKREKKEEKKSSMFAYLIRSTLRQNRKKIE